MKANHFNFDSSRLPGAGDNHSPISKIRVWILQAIILSILIFILSVTLPLTGFAESVDSKIQEGISQYHEGKFKDAGQSFSSAHADRPDDSRIAYNQGNAHYKEGSFPEALQAFTHSSLDEKNPDIRKNSIYNAGNTLVKLGKLKKAESAYKKVLRLDSDDMDAKFNLEYVRQQLTKKEDQKQDSDQGNQKNEDNDSSSEKEQGENQKQNKDQQAENQPPPSPPENDDAARNDPETSEQPGKPGMEVEISEKEAERMLEKLAEDLKSISRMQAGKTKSSYQGNDW